MTWESVYNFFHIKDFIYFISSSQIQDMLLPVKVVFIFCALFFLVFVIYLMINSSWIQYNFLEDVADFFSWQAYGQRRMEKQWSRIRKRAESGAESDCKLAIIDADDFLTELLDNRGYEGETFEEILKKAGGLIEPIIDDILNAHQARNSIVYNPDFEISSEQAKKILDTYETASRKIGV